MPNNPPLLPKVKERVSALRRNMTIPERLLWGKLHGGRLAGLKFRRQHPLDPYIVDFYCHEKRVVIELDGDSHIDRGKRRFESREVPD